jgi:hypothetical protein
MATDTTQRTNSPGSPGLPTVAMILRKEPLKNNFQD